MILLREEMYQHQRSRINWLTCGDKNTSFFHATVTQRRQRNQLVKIRGDDGRSLVSGSAINDHLASFFTTLFKARDPRDFEEALSLVPLSVTDRMNEDLLQPLVDGEIKRATFQLGSLKAPGPDGFPGLFYHKHWDVVSLEVCRAVKCFFNSEVLLKDLNHTNLILIPKSQPLRSLVNIVPSACAIFL